ncbi:MAG: divergent polysaccharide deacetylase family protein [Acidiphilium sp.]|nr:divergent polysaccharide deacetylase family protein [Acidiphilium sp.]MDD4935007.1 divergent polysaccharide deacetylase family protein [Acidiphilium sp.]
MQIPASLKLFWSGIAALLVIGVTWLQILGPIQPVPALVPRGATSGIPVPSPVLLVASSVNPHWKIPHPSPYGVTPMDYYAARAAAPSDMPRVAIMVGGIGYALAPSLDAVRDLPPQISLALSPYGAHDDAIAEAARAAGHETLMGLPMQVNGEPDITAGDQALHAGSGTAHNLKRLDWALSRVTGYAGVTDAIGLTAPETFLWHKHAAAWLAGQLVQAGVFMVIAVPNTPTPGGMNNRVADTTIDPAQGVATETAALNQLATIAITKGRALGVLMIPTPPAIATLASWCKGLAAQHIALVPVSALAAPASTP